MYMYIIIVIIGAVLVSHMSVKVESGATVDDFSIRLMLEE